MVVAVPKELEEIKKALQMYGHEVVDLIHYQYPIDAMIYEGNSFQISCISRNNMPQAESGQRSHYGVLIINAFGKSIHEIVDILETRYYSPLFH